jgi:hypothetical protein
MDMVGVTEEDRSEDDWTPYKPQSLRYSLDPYWVEVQVPDKS